MTDRDCNRNRGKQQRYVARLRDRLLDHYGRACCVCGGANDLEFAHLAPTRINGLGRGKKARLLDIQRHPESYALICRPHHKLFDRGKIKLDSETPF